MKRSENLAAKKAAAKKSAAPPPVNCSVCGVAPGTFFEVLPSGLRRPLCRACEGMSPAEQYDVVKGRVAALLDQAKAMCSEAFHAGDAKGVAFAQESIRELEKAGDGLYVPEGRR